MYRLDDPAHNLHVNTGSLGEVELKYVSVKDTLAIYKIAQGMPDLKYYKLNKEQLELAFNYLCAVGTMPHYIQQEYIEQ